MQVVRSVERDDTRPAVDAVTFENRLALGGAQDDDRSFGRSLKRLLIAKGFAAEYFQSASAFLDSVPFDQLPEMKAAEVTEAAIAALQSGKYRSFPR